MYEKNLDCASNFAQYWKNTPLINVELYQIVLENIYLLIHYF